MSVEKDLAEAASEKRAGSSDVGCFSGLELALEGGPLRELDPEKLKNEIKRWAKAVVAYARQLSMGDRARSEGRR